MKSELTVGLMVLALGLVGCSEGMNGTGSNTGSSPHVVNRPTDTGTMPSANPDASGMKTNPSMNGSNPATPGAPGSSNPGGALPTTGSDATATPPSTYAPSQTGPAAPSATDNGSNAGAKAPTETTTPPNGR